MNSKPRIAIILGSAVSAAALCAGIEHFYPSGALVPRRSPVSRAPGPERTADAQSVAAPRAEKSIVRRVPAASAPAAPAEKLFSSPATAPVSQVVAEPRLAMPLPVLPPVVLPPPPVPVAEPRKLAEAPRSAPLSEISAPTAPETAEQPKVPEAPPPTTAEAEKPELWIKPSVGYGVRYFQLEQSGAFGGIKGASLVMNELSFDTKLRYGAWSLTVGLEKLSAQVAGDTVDPTIRAEQERKRFYLEPGYGIFFLGVDAKTAPVVRASGTTLQWAGVTTLSASAGIRQEWLFDEHRRKPFLLGIELKGSLPLGASGEGGAPAVSSPKGYGAFLRGYVEKPVLRREDYRISLGLDAAASYDRLDFTGNWGGTGGSATRSTLEAGSKVYVGFEF